MHSKLVLFPLVGFHGRQEWVLEGFHVGFFLQVVSNYGGFPYEILSNSWFIGISTLGTFIGWWTINLTFLRFCKPSVNLLNSRTGANLALLGAACRVQGMDRNDKTRFAYKSPWQPYLSIWGVFWTTFFILVNGFTVFYKWDVSKFLTSCTFRLFRLRDLC